MARRDDRKPTTPPCQGRRERAKAALDTLIEAVHDDHRVLEGEELVRAVHEIFRLVRPHSDYKEPK